MTNWIVVPGSDDKWHYDTDAYDTLPENRKDYWDKIIADTDVTISNGIRTNNDGTELYMRVKKANIDPENVTWYENELNKTYYDKKI